MTTKGKTQRIEPDEPGFVVKSISFDPAVLKKLDELAAAHNLTRSLLNNEMLKMAMDMPSMFRIPGRLE